MDGDAQDDGSAALARRLRIIVARQRGGNDGPAGWRDDFRLFALTWAAGFVFFMIVFA